MRYLAGRTAGVGIAVEPGLTSLVGSFSAA